MAFKVKVIKAKKISYGSSRSPKDIKYIVFHFTGNKGDTAKNNAKYFANGNTREAGAHIFLDGGKYIYKSVPILKIAWAVGGFVTSRGGAAKYYKKCTNANSISFEMCNCVGGVPEKVFNQAVEVTKAYMKKYNIPADHVIRHWDVSGKDCPAPWTGSNNAGWKKFKKAISSSSSSNKKYTTIKKTSSKEAIKWMQKKLNACYTGKLPELAADGIWGSKTQKMLEAYWKQLGWEKGTYAGSKTCNALYKNRKK